MRLNMFSVLMAVGAIGVAVPNISASYEAPWSNVDFLQDQAWFHINNRLIDMNMEGAIRSGRSQTKSQTAKPHKHVENVSREVLALGDAASTDLAPVRPYLQQTQWSESQAGAILDVYAKAAARLNVPANDSASGIAAFLAGSYAAYTNRPFPDELYQPLYEQFAQTLAADPSLAEMPLAQRREYYQRLVIVGMTFQLLQSEMQENPQADQIASMRKAAESAFTNIAGISPDRIRFTVNGMTVN